MPSLTKLQLVDPDTTANFLGTTKATLEVWRCTKRYDLPYYKIGRKVMYDMADLVDFVEARKVRPVTVEGR